MEFKTLKENLLNSPDGGLLVYHFDVGSSTKRIFIARHGDSFSELQIGAERIEKKADCDKLFESFRAKHFWDINNFHYTNVFDGHYYIAVVKLQTGDSKTLELSNPEYAESEKIGSFLSFLEAQIFGDSAQQ